MSKSLTFTKVRVHFIAMQFLTADYVQHSLLTCL